MPYIPGTTKVRCDRTGAIVNSSRCRKMWNGLFVLKELWEPRHPQDFAPTIKPEPVPQNARPWGEDTFIEATDISASDL